MILFSFGNDVKLWHIRYGQPYYTSIIINIYIRSYAYRDSLLSLQVTVSVREFLYMIDGFRSKVFVAAYSCSVDSQPHISLSVNQTMTHPFGN